MQFDLRKFIVSGTKPYAAEFQCDLSAKDFAGARIEQPVTARFEAVPDGEEIRMTLRANALVHGECARCLDPVEREETVQAEWTVRGARSWMTRISTCPSTKKDIWMWMNGSVRNSCSRYRRCCFAALTARACVPGAGRRWPNVPALRQKLRPNPQTQG